MTSKYQYDIVAVTESWLNEHTDTEIELNGYTHFRQDRSTQRGGGVILYSRNTLKPIHVSGWNSTSSACETVWCSVRLRGQMSIVLIVGCVYRPPNCSIADSKSLLHDLSKFCSSHSNSDVLLMGDFNYPNINWNAKKFCSNSRVLQHFIDECMLTQHTSKPTRGENILDLVMTRIIESHTVQINHMPPIGRSDHASLSIQMSISVQQRNNLPESACKFKINYKLANWIDLCAEVKHASWSDFMSTTDIERAWLIFKSNLLSAVEHHIPKSPTRNGVRKCPWFRNQDLSFLEQKKLAWRKYRKTRSDEDLCMYKMCRNYAATKLKLLRR